MPTPIGKFIVIDGNDGTGKATQVKILANKLRLSGFEVELADFPQYGQPSASLVEEYLNGKYGSAEEVGPYRASIFYAADRYAASFKIREWLGQGKIVISNRYVTANMAHQGGKLKNPLERKHFFEWLHKLEFELFNIPKPDLTILLHLDSCLAQQLVDKKDERQYLNGGKRDIHENDINHLRDAEQVYCEIADAFDGFCLLEVGRGQSVKSREEVAHSIWQRIVDELGKIETPEIKEPLALKIERLSPTAKLPTRSFEHDAGLDLYSNDYYSIMPNEKMTIQTGIKLAIPPGHAGLIWDKNSLASDGIHTLAGVIDPGYRGEATVTLINLSQDIYHIAPGQRVAQLLLQKVEAPLIIEGTIDDRTDRKESNFDSQF